jgi:hypothetical protein
MVFIKSRQIAQRGFSQGTLIWFAVILCVGMIVKSEFFPGISKGMSADDLLYKFGQPVSKTAIPRPA